MAQLTRRAMRARKKKALKLIAGGQLTAEVAEAIGVTVETVRRWVREARSRTHSTSSGQASPPDPLSASREGEKLSEKVRRRGSEEAKDRGIGSTQTVAEMVQAEAPAVARVLLDRAKEGDVRAVALVMKLLGDSAINLEDREERDADADQRELERELQSLPPTIASEIVGLLAKADRADETRAGGQNKAVGGRAGRPVSLPWRAESDSSDEGDSAF